MQGFLLTPFPRCNAIVMPIIIISSILSQVLIAGPIGSISCGTPGGEHVCVAAERDSSALTYTRAKVWGLAARAGGAMGTTGLLCFPLDFIFL